MLAPNLYSIKKYKERKFGKIGNVCLKRLVRCLFYVLFFGALLNLAGKYLRPKVKRAEPKAHRLCNAIRMVDGRILGWGGCSVGHGDGDIFGVPQPFNCPSSQVSKTLWPSGPEWEIKREIKYQMKCWQLGNFHRTALHCVQLDGSRAISNQIVQFTYLFECNVCYWNA